MKKARDPITATLDFSRYALLRQILLNSENEEDEAVLLKGISHVLRVDRSLLKRIFRGRQ